MTARKPDAPPRRFWTAAELDLLRAIYADTPTAVVAERLGSDVRRVQQKANAMRLLKSAAYVAEESARRVARLRASSAPTLFKAGSTPWNKGVSFTAGGRSAETRFGKGMKPHTWVPVGSYRIVPDGILEQKVNDLPGPNHIRWHPVHRMVWEAEHGPVPKGHAVVFRAGMRTNVLEQITLDRIECITRQELMRRNSMHTRLPPELAAAVHMLGALKRKIRETAEKQETQTT